MRGGERRDECVRAAPVATGRRDRRAGSAARMNSAPDLAHLRSIGLAPDAAERALRALQAGDLRGFVHELLLHGLWSEVVDEALPRPQWIERWRRLAAEGFPIVDAAALERLLDAGVDVHDLTGVVRSAQVLAIHNIAQLLDYPATGLGWDLPSHATPYLACGSEPASGTQRLHALRPELPAHDPSGRSGEPCPRALRQWQALPEDVRDRIRSLVRTGRRAQAAASWKRHVGGELQACLEAVDALRGL